MSSNSSGESIKKKDEEHEHSIENEVLIKDLEIEVFSSTQLIDVEKCLETLKRVQEVYDISQENVKELQNEEKSLESDLLDNQILIEKAFLEYNENSRLLSQLKKEQEVSKARYDDCKSAEEVSQQEFKTTDPLHQDLQSQSKDVEALNQEIVTAEFEKRHLELNVVIDELKASKKEMDVQKKLLILHKK